MSLLTTQPEMVAGTQSIRDCRGLRGSAAMDYGILPPEINSSRIYAGPGSGPMLAAASAWDGLAAELGSAASGLIPR